MLSKEHADILAGIQEELRANEVDRIEESGQASPVYYGIIDRERYVTAEGWHDDVVYYDTASCCELDDEEIAQYIDEYTERHEECDRDYAAEHWREDYDEIDERYVAYCPFIAKNRMFLTRAEAEAHLESNYYHYTDWAHTYAMTAWRSPQVERLLNVLHEADFTVEGDES